MKNESVEIMVIGASTRFNRYSHMAVRKLSHKGYKVTAIGRKSGDIDGVQIHTTVPSDSRPQTILMYLAPKNQSEYLDVIVTLKPSSVIFSPGTENPEFEESLKANGIQVQNTCALIMMSLNKL